MIQIAAQDAYQKLQKDTNLLILDVRTQAEFAAGHIENAVNIPLDALREQIEKAVPDKSKQIYVYCLSGSRSTQAATLLENLGYQHVFNIQSGLLAWRIHQLPLVS